VDRVREIDGFSLDNVPRAARLESPALPDMVPVIFHGHQREAPAPTDVVALPFYRMFDRRTGEPRWKDHESLCAEYALAPGTTILLTGTQRDPPLERWWGFGTDIRRPIIRALKAIGIQLVTTPNYSLFLDRPRWDDMHAMKRIAIVHEEFLAEGLPAALHVNSRTEKDFQRWAAFLAARPEITHVAYEFTTGTGWAHRRQQHADWLAMMAAEVGRPLHLLVRGGLEIHPIIIASFARVTVLDTTIFMKTMMRQRAVLRGKRRLAWHAAPTLSGVPVHDLFAENFTTVARGFGMVEAPSIAGDFAPV
jgi:hypothetical protein